MKPISVVLMIGPAGPGDIERMVAAARRSAAADLLVSLKQIPAIDQMIVAAPLGERAYLDWAHDPRCIWDDDPPQRPFHFGQRLAELIQKYKLAQVLYASAGSMPLMSAIDLAAVLSAVANHPDRFAFTNNLHSADWVAFTQAENIAGVAHWLDRDNMLAWRLRENAGYHVASLPPSGATRLDIDTPFDLRVLALHPQAPAQVRALLQKLALALNLKQLNRAVEILSTPGKRVTLIGRVPAAACQQLEKLRLWTRVFSEERGMVANGRQARGQVFSFVADYVDHLGEPRFVTQLAQTSDLVLFDTRVYLAHHRCQPPAEDRFASDLGQPDKIGEPRLRRLTEAALGAPIPILLGGHTMVSGGLYALLESIEAMPA